MEVINSDSSDSSGVEVLIADDDVQNLRPLSDFAQGMITAPGSAHELSEDLHSELFYEPDDERWAIDETSTDTQQLGSPPAASIEELSERALNDQEGGLANWEYTSPFEEVGLELDDVDEKLTGRFIVEGHEMLRRLREDAATNRIIDTIENDNDPEFTTPECEQPPLTRLEAVKAFLPDSILGELAAVANQDLRPRKKQSTTANEMLGMIALHLLCASYDEAAKTVCDPDVADHFLKIGLSAARYKDIWSALTGSRERRGVIDDTRTGWCRTNNRSTFLILEIEQEVAACNRHLLYVPGATILSLDDDHLRMFSHAVTSLTSLQQHNNPKKDLGPVGSALYSALHPVFFACHFSRVGDKLLDIWQRLMQLLQGAATAGPLIPMTDSIVADERGYNASEIRIFLSQDLGISPLGTHKRDLWYHFVFGDGAIGSRHRGMEVSERGCRAVYNARFKSNSSSLQGRQVEAVLYRESCFGRIASMIVNDPRQFRARGFTVVPHHKFRGEDDKLEQIVLSQTLFDSLQGLADGMQKCSVQLNPGKLIVKQVLKLGCVVLHVWCGLVVTTSVVLESITSTAHADTLLLGMWPVAGLL